MSQVAAPSGIRPIYHPSGEIRQEQLRDGILSGYTSAIYTGTPVKFNTDGTLIVCGTGVDTMVGIFAGCEWTKDGRRFIQSHFPANTTYDVGSMIAKFQPIDGNAVYTGQTAATIAATAVGEAINLANASQGNIMGQSTQALSAPTGATLGMFKIIGLLETPDNDWGDPFVWLKLVVPPTAIQVPIA